MFSSKQTLVVPELHGEQNANTANLGQVPNLELESGTTGAPGHIVQQDGDKFDLQFGRMNFSGTVTGTISSSTTFPSGHIIQTQTAESTLANAVSTAQLANSGTVGLDVASVDITPRGTGSKFLIQCRVCFNFSRTTNYQCASQYIGRGVGSGGMSGSDLSTIYHFSLLGYMGTQAGNDVYMDHPLFFVDDTVTYSSGQTITYNFRLGSGRGSGSVGYPTVYYRNDGGNYFPAQMIVTEIAV